MKAVQLGRVARPFSEPPFENYIQSPIGLVPKLGNKGKTCLIFHLLYNFGTKYSEQSLNKWTPRELCSVRYNDLDNVVKNCLITKEQAKQNVHFDKCEGSQQRDQEVIYLGKTDVESAFCLVPLSPWSWMWLVMFARDPITKLGKYFMDKCLPFGASISCAIFQKFSDALCHITKINHTGEL